MNAYDTSRDGDGSGRLPPVQDGELPRRVDKPWGHELWFAHTDRYAGKLLHVRTGERLSVQFHEAKDETSYLLSGRLLLSKGANPDALTETESAAGAVWRNEPGQVHTIEAVEDSVVIEVSTPELDDVVRLSDDYGRAGTSAP
jgi:mannose-6-phosphate isomerase